MEQSQANTTKVKSKKENGPIDTNGAMTRRYSEPTLGSKPKSQEDPEEKRQRLYKTEICRNWEEQNACRYGDKCQYAHGKEELRYVKRHPRYKTVYCHTYETLGACPYGNRCTFMHESSPPSLQSSLESLPVNTQQFVNHPTTALPRLSISSSSSSSSSIFSTSSSSTPIFLSLSQQQQYLNFCHDYQQNRLAYIDDYQRYQQYWSFAHPPSQEQPIKTQKYQLPGSRTPQDLFTDGDVFQSALGVTPPPLSSSPPSSLYTQI